LAGVFIHLFLFPPVSDRFEQGYERGGRGNDDLLFRAEFNQAGSACKAALKKISPGRNITTNSGVKSN
jgi:hypothetical protein